MGKTQKEKSWIVLTIVFAGYLIFNGILLAGHELWRDEANVWLFARDTTPLQLLREIKYQGHPCLWYFMVMPFAKLGLPFVTLSVLSYTVMAVAAGLFVYRGPFHPITKAVCLFSPIFSYYYSVVARNYCLIALILLMLAWLYPKRKERSILYGALLGLLVQADTIALAAAGLISLMWLWESVREGIREKDKGKRWEGLKQAAKGLWLPLASLLLWIAEFRQVSDSPEFQIRQLSLMETAGEIRSFSVHMLDRMTGGGAGFAGFFILLFLVTAVLRGIRSKNFWPMLVVAGSFLFEAVFSIMVYQLHIWHYIALCFVLIWCFWVSADRKAEDTALKGAVSDKVEIIIRGLSEGLLILLGITMFIQWNTPKESSSLLNALNGLYSDGVHTAEYIRENIGTQELIVVTDVTEAATVQAYLGKEYVFYFAGDKQAETYADYTNEQAENISYEELINWVKESFPYKEAFYLLKCPENCIEDIPKEAKEAWEICYQTTEETARGEEYTLYRIGLSE